MMPPGTTGFMALLCGQLSVSVVAQGQLRAASFGDNGSLGIGPNRTWSDEVVGHVELRRLTSHDKVIGAWWLDHSRTISLAVLAILSLTMSSMICHMFHPPGGQGQQNMRLPPRWDPSMESSTPFRLWVQDLMLWAIVTDLAPHQQCAAIIAQLGGAARDLARTISPQEVYNGGMVNGVQLDPVSYLLHGLSMRFGPLDEEHRLRAATDLLSFRRRQGESVDALISRFDVTRQLAQRDGGGAVSTETAALILLRACNVSSAQFQTLTQPFGLRLPANEPELAQLGHHLRRMGHIVEHHPHNIASGLHGSQGQSHQTYLAEADTGSSTSGGPNWQDAGADMSFSAGLGAPMDWAFAAVQEDASDTDSATSSDNDEPMPVEDLQGLSPAEADEYLFGEYQHAKKRWRRFTGKPVRALRRVLRRKGKGKGKSKHKGAYLNIGEVLRQSSYFKGKGKGGKSSGKGFGRKLNPVGRDGEVMKCSTCGSSYHLRARCPRGAASAAPAAAASNTTSANALPQRAPPTFTVEPANLHFAAYETDSSWTQVSPRSNPSVAAHRSAAPSEVGVPQQPSAPSVHHLSPDPWETNPDPWQQWMQQHDHAEVQGAPSPAQAMRVNPGSTWLMPGVGVVGSSRTFGEMIGAQIAANPPPAISMQAASQQPPHMFGNAAQAQAVEPSAAANAQLGSSSPAWFAAVRQGMQQIQSSSQGSSRRRSSDPEERRQPVPSLFMSQAGFPMMAAVPETRTIALPEMPARPASPPAVAQAVNVFGQVHALRSSLSSARSSGSSRAVSSPNAYQGHVTRCTVCLDEFGPGDHMCRLTCGHVFHCSCLAEAAQHAGFEEAGEGSIAVRCPNCRAHGPVVRTWHYPRLPTESSVEGASQQLTTTPQAPSPDVRTPESDDNAVLATPSQHEDHEQDEFLSPMESFPWWPIPQVSDAETEPGASAYHSNVRLQDGRVGLLIDPGSYGNLVGEEWLSEASSQLAKQPQLLQRAVPLQVGGVGRGAQTCRNDCQLPIAMCRSDGSVATGSFTSPVVAGSGCPALLGLRTLQENRALLDTGKKQLHFLGSGEATIILPPGSETFALESAQSGHLLLPCSEFARASADAPQGEHHLFSEPKAECSEGAFLSTTAESQLTAEEQECQAALANYDFESAVAAVLKIMKREAEAPRSAERSARRLVGLQP